MKKFRKLALAFLGAFLCVGVGVGAAVGAGEAKGAKAANKSYEVTIDSSNNGENNVHWTSASQTSISYNSVTWNTSVTGTSTMYSSTTYCQIGTKKNPATQVSISTGAFAGKTIVSASYTGYCFSNVGPVLNIVAGSTNILSDCALVKGTSTTHNSTNKAPITMGNTDTLSFVVTSNASAAIIVSKITVTYVAESSATINSFAVSNSKNYFVGDVVLASDFTVTPTLSDSSTPESIANYVTIDAVDTSSAGEKTVNFTYDSDKGPYEMSNGVSNKFTSSITVNPITYETYTLVQNDLELLAGAKYIIAGSYNKNWYALSKNEISSNVRSTFDLNTSSSDIPASFLLNSASDFEIIKINNSSTTGKYVLEAQKTNGTMYFVDNQNYLKTDSTKQTFTDFDITIEDDKSASIFKYDDSKQEDRYLQLNGNNRFAGYITDQNPIYLYKDNTVVSSISIINNPTKTTYAIGDDIDLTGFKVNGTLSTSETVDVTRNCTVSPSKFTEAGEVTVTVTCGSATAQTFQVTVQNKTVDHIAVTTQPTKTSYNFGDTLDTTGLVVTKYYNAEGTDYATCDSNEYTVSPENGTKLTTSGTTSVTVTHTSTGKTTSFDVTVAAYVDVLEIGSKYAFSGVLGDKTYELIDFPSDSYYGASYEVVKYLSLGLTFTVERGTYINTYKFKSSDNKYLYRYDAKFNSLLLGNPEVKYGDQGVLESSWYVEANGEDGTFKIWSAYLPDDAKFIKVYSSSGNIQFGNYAAKNGSYVSLTKVDARAETRAFVENYMHPEIGIEEGKTQDTGACKYQGWYENANTAFEALSEDAQELFYFDEEFEDYFDRLDAWEKLQKKYTDSGLVILNSEDAAISNGVLAIIIVSAICLTSFEIIFLIRKSKRKHEAE